MAALIFGSQLDSRCRKIEWREPVHAAMIHMDKKLDGILPSSKLPGSSWLVFPLILLGLNQCLCLPKAE